MTERRYEEIPVNEYYEYFGPDYQLDVRSSNADDLNSRAYLDRVTRIVMENLRNMGGPPSVQMQGIYYCFILVIKVLTRIVRYTYDAHR